MDFFYKPPIQRPDECGALEDNYINCMMQKALKDRVQNNKCVMDSILWFHLECPRHAAAFDDPGHFKLKFRDFFAHQKLDAQILFEKPEHMEKLRREYDSNASPDDTRYKPAVASFMQEFKEHDPIRVPEEDAETDNYSSPWDELIAVPDREYGLPRPAPPLSNDDSAKFGGSAKPMF